MISILAMTLAAATPQVAPAPDYAGDAAWLCRGTKLGMCDTDLSTTVVAADGARTAQRFVRAADPGFDCFYVYPTVSLDKTPNSDLAPGIEERQVIMMQAARFGQVCRVFAPIYRQVTLTALRSVMAGAPMTADRDLAYGDVKAAWGHYLANDNKGRGVVLIGHSQGSGMLKRLVAAEIAGKPAQKQMIAAYLTGTNVSVKADGSAGGDLPATPMCKAATDTACHVSYVTFRAEAPPPAKSRFGRAEGEGLQVACVNPAALTGNAGDTRAYLSAVDMGPTSQPMGEWSKGGAAVKTPFVTAPGLLAAECVAKDGASYLALTTRSDPTDARTDSITGDIVAGGVTFADWGLHLIDMNVVMGDLIALADMQAKAWNASKGKTGSTR